jgi:DNA-binding NarL/FixJ family response regulator
VLTPTLAEKIIGLARTGMGRHAIRKTTGLGKSIIAAVVTPWIEAGRPEDASAVIASLMADRERGRLRAMAGKPLTNREVIMAEAQRLRAEGLSVTKIARRLEVSAGWVGRATRPPGQNRG